MENSNAIKQPSFSEVIEALRDYDVPFPHQFLYNLSDLTGEELEQFKTTWPSLPDWRRQGLLEDLDTLFENDTLLSYESICRLALTDPNPQVRVIALHSLQGYEVKDLIPEILRLLEEDEDEEMRALAAANLGKYVYLGETEKLHPSHLTAIENSLLQSIQAEETNLVRQRALEALGYSSRPEVPNLIETAFNTQEEAWITSALFSIGRTYDKSWEPKVLKMLVHQAPRVRLEAVRAAGELGITAARPHLIDALENDEPEVRLAAVWSLSQIGGESLQQIFENLLKETESDDEAEIIEEALDNLIFNQSIGFFDDF